MKKKAIVINKQDNVAIALLNLSTGITLNLNGNSICIKEDIRKGHKFALNNIEVGEDVIKYGMSIGKAYKKILTGEWVHIHNIKTKLDDIIDYEYRPSKQQLLTDYDICDRKIFGYKRSNGKVGIRNELWIVPTVGCINESCDLIIDAFKKQHKKLEIDSIFAFKHSFGCSQLGDDHYNTQKILQNIIRHPNAGGVLILGLGCENNQVSEIIKTLGVYDKNRIKFLVAQNVKDEVKEGVKFLNQIYKEMKKDIREPVSFSNLVIGLKCGGSDGLSGITANPMLGKFTDYFVGSGGSVVLTEVPEMFGAETILMNRAKNENVFKKIVEMINNFKNYFKFHNQVIYENPSQGNKEGGISTLEEKSLGCVQKGGSAEVSDVIGYGDLVKSKGLSLLYGPGNDLVASTALAAAGCHMVLFTTGRGTPYGTFVPTVKISSNSNIYRLKPNWIDFDAGKTIANSNIEKETKLFIDYLIDVANCKLTLNETNNFKSIAIFKQGIVL